MSAIECGLPAQLSFSAREVADGTFFKAIEDYDPDGQRMLYHLEMSYHEDPILNLLTPWERPPLKNVFCIYGVDSKTEKLVLTKLALVSLNKSDFEILFYLRVEEDVLLSRQETMWHQRSCANELWCVIETPNISMIKLVT